MPKSKRRSYLFAIITTVTVLIGGGYYVTALGLGFFVFVLVDFVEKIGSTVPILETLLLISSLQWIVGPYTDYISEYKHYKYHMYVSEEAYMDLVVPSLFLFSLPVYYFSSKINYALFIKRVQQLKIPYRFAIALVVAGFFSEVVGRFAPASLGFVFFLASGMRFIGFLYLFYTNHKSKWTVFWFLFAAQFLAAVGGGLFHGLLLWSVFILLFISIFYKFSFMSKLLYLSLGFTSIFLLQSIKADFRKAIWKRSYEGNKVELFITLFSDKLSNFLTDNSNATTYQEEVQDEETGEANNRLNQGWVISRIMDNIPNKTPYLEGETISVAIYSSLFPRFLVESKAAGGGGRLTYEKLTGFHLAPGTSMGTGILGEAYGNFGVEGTYLFMLLWGIFLGLFIKFVFKKSNIIYSLPLWLPIIFLQVIKAETDLFTVLNHLVKSTVFVFGVLYIARKFYRIHL